MSSGDDEIENVSIVLAGNVDSGKSTFLGVITHGELDNGNGSARSKVAKHQHEIKSGRTSDISTRTIKVSPTKYLNMVDLCGHQKYLKTTLFGITGYFPDYGILVVSANRGFMKMTKEHMGILLFMNIPFTIIITRIDLVSNNPEIYEKTVRSIKRICRRFTKQVRFINSDKEYHLPEDELKIKYDEDKKSVERMSNIMATSSNLIPVVTVSNKTGYYIDVIKHMLNDLKPRNVWRDEVVSDSESIFYIDSKFTPKGVGLVVSGVLKGKSVKIGDELLIGPYGKQFVPVKVWSLHDNDRNSVNELKHRYRGCLALRVLDKKIDFGKQNVRKGMVVINKTGNINKLCYQFKSDIRILNHSTTISGKYSPVIHCGTVRQTARIIIDDNKKLKLGDEATVSFRFISHPEFVEVGTRFFFREGTTRGVGTVTEIIPIHEDPNPEPAQPKKRTHRRKYNRKRNRKRGNTKSKADIKVI